jgi:hypothetical protein
VIAKYTVTLYQTVVLIQETNTIKQTFRRLKMIKIILAFLIAFGICYFGIKQYRDLSGKDKWALTKLVGYSMLCALVAIVLLMLIVILF